LRGLTGNRDPDKPRSGSEAMERGRQRAHDDARGGGSLYEQAAEDQEPSEIENWKHPDH
jgi:hypothetical protein